MPTRFIHSRSLVIPSLVTLPLVQCHQARGFAAAGGFLNSCSREPVVCARAVPAMLKRAVSAAAAAKITGLRALIIFLSLPKYGIPDFVTVSELFMPDTDSV